MHTRKFLLTGLSIVLTCVAAKAQINSNTFGMMEARQIGPGTMSGRISAIEGVAEDGKTIYIGTAGGGVWKTTNAGASFKPIFDKYCQSIGAIAINQKNSKVVYVGTGESNMRNSVSIGNGLYKTTDAGDNWNRIGLDSTEKIAKIAINPNNPDVVYVAAPGPLWADSKHRGLYKTTDAGKTWEKILYINEKAGVADVAIDPANPETVYASSWEFRRLPYLFNSGGNGSGMYKSMDGGKTWKELTNGLPAKPFGRIAFTLAPSAPQNMVAIVEAKETGLYISADGGESWKKQSATLNVVSRPFYFSTIVVDPKDPKRVYRPAYSFSYSNDGGYSFAEASGDGGWVHSDHHALWINPNNTNHMYLGTDGGVYVSMDRGATWLFLQNLPVGQFYHVATDNQEPYRIYGGLQDNGSWVAPSAAPGGVSNSNWMAIYGGDGFWTIPDPTDPNTAYAEYQGGNVARINLTTVKNVSIKPQQAAGEEKLRWNWNTPLAIGQKNAKNLYMGAQYLYKSTDQGRNWTRISADLTTNDKKKQEQENSGGLSADNTSAENHCTIFTITESPLDENLVWAGTDDGNLQYTSDGGKTWTNVAANYKAAGIPAQTWISSIEPSRFDKNTVYASFDNHMYGDHQTYIGKSTDMGKTWTLFKSNEFTGFAHKIKEDLTNKNLLFAGTEMGLFSSVDGGATWFRMKNNIPWYALVRDIQIHPKTNDLVIATHGRGIIILDDITPIRNLTKDIADKEVYLFETGTQKLTTGNFGDGGFPSTGGWNGGNPAAIAPIQYYLKDRLNTGDVKVEIYDAAGKLVQSIPGSKRKGINRVYWNQRMKPPKVATGSAKIDFGGFIAPQVLPGNYTVKLKVADKEYSNGIQLVHDENNKSFTTADRQKQFDASMQLYTLHEELAKTVEDITGKQKMLKENIDKTKNAKLKKLLQEYHDKLETLRAECLATKQKSIFADEERIRERITDVYQAVAGQEAAPSNLQIQRISVLQNEVSKA
ncbi:MAG: glycosyl hydrolase, partial [Sphingobacteriales bacterium]